MSARVSEIPGFHCRLQAPDADYRTARDIRLSPIHRELAEAGARFALVNAWERPLWMATGADTSCWLGVADEVRAATEAVGWSLIARRMPSIGSTIAPWAMCGGRYCPRRAPLTRRPPCWWLCRAPTVRWRCSRAWLRWTPDRTLLLAGPEQDTRLLEWLRLARGIEAAGSLDATSAHLLLELYGPRRHELIAAWPAPRHSLPFREDAVHDSTLVFVPREDAADMWRRLVTVGREFGLRIGGHFAEEVLRIQRGIPGFGHEATPARLISELGPPGIWGRLPSRDRFPAPPRTHRPRVLAAFSSTLPLLGFGAREVVLSKNRTVGELTSRIRLPDWPLTQALALLDPVEWQAGPLEVVADGQRWPLEPRRTSWAMNLTADEQ